MKQLPDDYVNPNQPTEFKTGRSMPIKSADFVALEKDFDPPLPEEEKELVRIGVVNWLNFHKYRSPGEVNNQPSLTVPNQSMSIKEIRERAQRNLPINLKEYPLFYDYDAAGNKIADLPDLNKMDLAERHEYVERLNARISDLRQDLQKQAEDVEKQKQAAEIAAIGVSDASPSSSIS